MISHTPRWKKHKPGNPLPEGNVRIRQENGWESKSFLPASVWSGWDFGFITHYKQEPSHEPK